MSEAEPAVSPPCRAFPLRSVNLEFAASHASADVAIYAGFADRIAASGSDGAVYVPALHPQAAAEVAPGAEVAPAGHETHAADEFAPVVTEYVPAVQLVHAADELAPVTDEYVPAGQFAHTVDAFAPVAPEYFPAGHARQSDVRLTQLFSCADAWAKTSFDRCVFQT